MFEPRLSKIGSSKEIVDECKYTSMNDVTDKWNRWLAGVMFDWRHVMTAAVEHNDKHVGL